MKKIFLFAIFQIVICQAQQDPKAEAILQSVSKKYALFKSYQANFVYELENTQAKVSEKFSGELKVKGAKFTANLGNQAIINDGVTVWTYMKEENEVTISDYKAEEDELNPSKIYNMYKNGFKYLHIGEEKSTKQTFDMIELVPDNKNKSYFKIKLWVSKKDKSVNKWKIFEKNGNRFNYSVSNFLANPKMDDAIFMFDKSKYKGIEIVDLR